MTSISGLAAEQKKAEILEITQKVRKYLKIPKSVKIHVVLGILTDCGQITQFSPNSYEIWIDKTLSLEMTRETIGHECQHICQFLDKRLEIKDNLLYFEGVNMTSVPYSKRPFEAEAKRIGREIRNNLLFSKK